MEEGAQFTLEAVPADCGVLVLPFEDYCVTCVVILKSTPSVTSKIVEDSLLQMLEAGAGGKGSIAKSIKKAAIGLIKFGASVIFSSWFP